MFAAWNALFAVRLGDVLRKVRPAWAATETVAGSVFCEMWWNAAVPLVDILAGTMYTL
jgi:hypothetical protein